MASTAPSPSPPRRWAGLREEAPAWQVFLAAILCIVGCFALWWFLTRGESEERILPYSIIPSPGETFSYFKSLWFDQELTRNIYASLRRVLLGFGLATVVGVPVGILCGCFPRVNAFFLPLTVMGRNIPIAALIPLTFSIFGIYELQKVMFIFIACVAFIISDTARAVADVGSHYLETAYTLGASRLQVVLKVLVPLALPSIFNSLRLLFGLAFGYIMLAELIVTSDTAGGLGAIINISQKRNIKEYILLVLMIIPLVALAIDRLLFWAQRELFPFRYGGSGLLNQLVRAVLHGGEDLRALIRKPVTVPAPADAAPTPQDGGKG